MKLTKRLILTTLLILITSPLYAEIAGSVWITYQDNTYFTKYYLTDKTITIADTIDGVEATKRYYKAIGDYEQLLIIVYEEGCELSAYNDYTLLSADFIGSEIDVKLWFRWGY